MSTPILPFAVWASGTNQASIPANDNSLRNQILNGLVISDAVTAQPGSPTAGDIYILAATHTGAQWAGFDEDDLVIFSGTWYAFAPVDGVVVNFDAYQQQWTTGGGWLSITGDGPTSDDDTGALPWIDVKVDHGAAGDGTTDDTAEIQAALDAAVAAGGAVVYFPKGVYVVGGALQDTSRSNAQLLLPIIDYVDTEQITIELRGEFAPPPVFSVVGATTLPDGHSVIKGTLNTTGGTAPCLIGTHGPAGTLADFSNVHVVVRNLTFRMPSNPVLTACDFSKCAAVDLDSVIVDCGNYYIQGLTEPTTSTSYAIKLPSNNNGANTVLGTVNVCGFYKGYQFAEHTNGRNVNAWGCKQAFEFVTATNHASVFLRLMAVHCERVIVATGAHYVSIAQLNVEHAASGWWITDFDVDDASNFLVGDLKWHAVLAGSGVSATFTVNGATNIRRTQLGSAVGTGDVVGPASATDSRIAAFDGTTGKLLKDGGKTIAGLRSPAIQTVTSSATVTPTFLDDIVLITAQAAGLTLANPTGTAIDGLGMVIRIKDNGTARTIGYGTQYRAIGVTLPTTTVISKTLYLGMVFNNTDTKWDVLAVGQEA